MDDLIESTERAPGVPKGNRFQVLPDEPDYQWHDEPRPLPPRWVWPVLLTGLGLFWWAVLHAWLT